MANPAAPPTDNSDMTFSAAPPADNSDMTFGAAPPHAAAPPAAPAHAPATLPGNPTATLQAHNPHSILGGDKDSDYHTPGESTGQWLEKEASGLLPGIGRGIFTTLSGANDIADKYLPGDRNETGRAAVRDTLHSLAEKHDNTTSGDVGYGGETLMEFLLGDEALKGMSMSEQLLTSGKVAKTLEGSPRLIDALKAGVRHATSAGLRTGAVQGAQTLVRSGGNVRAAARDAGVAAITGGAVSGATGVIGATSRGAGNAINAVARTGQTIGDMSEQAHNAIPQERLTDSLRDTLTEEKSKIDDAFKSETDAAEKNLQTGTTAAEDAKKAGTDLAEGNLGQAKGDTKDLIDKQTAGLNEAAQTKLTATQHGLDTARQGIQAKLVDTLDQVSSGAPATRDLAPKVNEGINNYEEASHTNFENGMNGEHGIIDRLGSEKMPVVGSPMSDGAKKILNSPNPADHPLVAGMKNAGGDKLDTNVKNILTNAANGAVTTGEGEAAKTVPMADMTAGDLVNLRQSSRATMSNYMRGDINRRALGSFIGYIDDTLDKMAASSGDPDVIKDYADLRNNYRVAKANLDTSTADKLNLSSPDQALDDVNKYLTSGGNPTAKINTLRQIIGDDSMQSLAMSKVQQWKQVAETNPGQFVKEWGKLTPDVREAFFGQDLTTHLQNAADTFNHTTAYAENYAKLATKAIQTEAKTGTASTQQAGKVLNEVAGSARNAAVADVNAKYAAGVSAAQDAYDAAAAASKERYGKAIEPFKGSFMTDLAQGRVNDKLLKGQVDPVDIKNVKAAIGDKWNGIADGIFQRAIADASPNGRFNPQKMWQWWDSIHPDVRTEMFNPDKAQGTDLYKQTMTRIEDAARTYARMHAGMKAAASLGAVGAGYVTGAIAGSSSGPMGELMGQMVGATGGLGATQTPIITRLADWAVNHPLLWRTAILGGKVVNSAPAKAAASAARGAASVARGAASQAVSTDTQQRNVYQGTAGPLGGAAPKR